MRFLLGVIFAMMVGCGAPPYPSCSHPATWRCEQGNTWTQMCNGKFWQPIQDCSDQWDEEGNSVEATCEEVDEVARCVPK